MKSKHLLTLVAAGLVSAAQLSAVEGISSEIRSNYSRSDQPKSPALRQSDDSSKTGGNGSNGTATHSCAGQADQGKQGSSAQGGTQSASARRAYQQDTNGAAGKESSCSGKASCTAKKNGDGSNGGDEGKSGASNAAQAAKRAKVGR